MTVTRIPDASRAVLRARSLATSHRRLVELLSPGLRVLDVGCGTGAVTRGIAEAVGPRGEVVGIDANPGMVEEARRSHSDVPGLAFQVIDARTLPYEDRFDVVTASRVLQWLPDPVRALRAMARAARPGGRVVVLEYNHEKIAWIPSPPASVAVFYAAFLRWRAEAGMDNAIADHLAGMFISVGLHEVAVTPQHEATRRRDAHFEAQIAIWAEVAASHGRQMVEEAVITEEERAKAEAEGRAWARAGAEAQTMYLLAVEGVRPGGAGQGGSPWRS